VVVIPLASLAIAKIISPAPAVARACAAEKVAIASLSIKQCCLFSLNDISKSHFSLCLFHPKNL